MTDYITFDGAVEPMIWGDKTYTVLRLPADVQAALGAASRVEGEIAEHPVNLAPSTAPVIEGQFLWAGKSLLKEIGITVGERVEVRLRPADPNQVETPEDLMAALRRAEATARWDALTPGKKRGLLHQINTAKRAATRAARIENLILSLLEAP